MERGYFTRILGSCAFLAAETNEGSGNGTSSDVSLSQVSSRQKGRKNNGSAFGQSY